MVVLTHDFQYYSRRRCGRDNLEQLDLFLELAQELGYVFRTIDTYSTDDVRDYQQEEDDDDDEESNDAKLFARSSKLKNDIQSEQTSS